MLGIFLLYFIAKPFYYLAEENGKNKWLYVVLAIATYYGSAFLTGMVIGIVALYFKYDISNIPDVMLGLMAVPFALLFVWLFYRLLVRKWTNNDIVELDKDILDDIVQPK